MNIKSVLPTFGRGILLCAVFLLSFQNLHSQQTVWTGIVDSDWHNADNWGQGLPQDGGKAVIPSFVYNTPVITGSLNLKYSIENLNVVQIGAGAVICNEGYFVNFSTGSIENNGKLINKGTILFDNDGIFDNNGTFENRGSFDNGGPNNLAVFNNNAGGTFLGKSGSVLVNTGTFNNNGTLIIEAESFVYHYFKFNNTGAIDNLGTFENFECAEFVNDTDYYVGGDFWNLGVLYLLSGDVHAMTMHGGIVLTSLNDAPKPTASCKDVTVTLDDNGMVMIMPADIDNGSNGPCFINTFNVSPNKFNCDNVGANTVTLTVTDFKDYSSSCTATVTVEGSSFCENDGNYCSYTQGFYGNAGGKKFGMTTSEIILAALSNTDGSNNPIIIGGGDRQLVLNNTAVDCIIEYLPAGGKATKLPEGTVNMTGDCETGDLPLKNNRFRNVLLGQTIALSLNVRYDVNLGGLAVAHICGISGSLKRVLPPNPTVNDILALANKALAGQVDEKYISMANDAASFINEHFDNCSAACSGDKGRSALFDLMAQPKGMVVDLTWISSTPNEVKSFDVERSLDGTIFETIQSLEPQENTDFLKSFEAQDASLLQGSAYYRIKRNLADGSFEYTPSRWIDLSYNGSEIRVFPNPATEGEFNMSLNRFAGQHVTVQIVNNLGVVVRTLEFDNLSEENVRLDVSDFLDGMYKIFVQPESQKAVYETLIIQRY
ncbi:MAG: hypothetical protein KDC24_06775 [Saprospiraceae bacterium]|nr:hypothetical protein [Saprospiraceae bacterium]